MDTELISKPKALMALFELSGKITQDRNNAYMNGYRDAFTDCYNAVENIPEEFKIPEPFTDSERRIFESAISREKKACRKLDATLCGQSGLLEDVCERIESKVKAIFSRTRESGGKAH